MKITKTKTGNRITIGDARKESCMKHGTIYGKEYGVETDHGDQPDISKNKPTWLRWGKRKHVCFSCLSKNTCFIFLNMYIQENIVCLWLN